jgi:uncharacterized membrane protein
MPHLIDCALSYGWFCTGLQYLLNRQRESAQALLGFSSIVAQGAWLATASKVEVYMKQGWASVSKAGAINLLDLVVFKWVRGEAAQLWVKEGG